MYFKDYLRPFRHLVRPRPLGRGQQPVLRGLHAAQPLLIAALPLQQRQRPSGSMTVLDTCHSQQVDSALNVEG
jgi:hypothetical protein